MVELFNNACLPAINLGGTEVLSVEFNINIFIIVCCYLWYCTTKSFRASKITTIHIALHCVIVLVPRSLLVAISALVAATSMCPEIFIKIYSKWVKGLSLASSGERSRRPVGVLHDNLTIVSGNELHQFSAEFLQCPL